MQKNSTGNTTGIGTVADSVPFFINNLANILPEGNINALFADDVSVLATHQDEGAERDAQKAVDVALRLASEWKVQVNAGKSESSFLSTCSREARWEPNIQVDGKKIRHEETQRLPGVHLDRNILCRPHDKQDGRKAENDWSSS